MTRPRSTFALISIMILAAALFGCDPKRIAGDGTGGTGGGDDSPPLGVTSSAAVIGSTVALYTDLLQAALSQSAAYADIAGVRSIFSSECITIETVPADDPIFDVRLDGCVDSNGTSYRGGVALFPINDFDGYYLWPHGAVEDMIIATNEGNSDFNHTFDAGNLQLIFERSSGEVSAVEVRNFVRHVIKTKTATFSFDGVMFSGGVGSHADYPRSGGLIHIAWDTVGVFDVEFEGGPAATFSIQGWTYRVNLSNGTVGLS